MMLLSGGMGCGTLLLVLAGARQNAQQKSWPLAMGRVLSSGVEKYRDRIGSGAASSLTTLYRPAVTYAYEVEGRSYESNVISSGKSVGSSLAAPAERAAARYPPGSTVRVSYNPANHAQSVLEFAGGALWLFLFLSIALLAFAAYLGGLWPPVH